MGYACILRGMNGMLLRFLKLASDFCLRLHLSGAQSLRRKFCLLLNHELGTYLHCVCETHSIGCSWKRKPPVSDNKMPETRNSVRQRAAALTNDVRTNMKLCAVIVCVRFADGSHGIPFFGPYFPSSFFPTLV